MRIAILQLNCRLGDPEGNGRNLEAAYAEALSLGAELVLAPELAVPGYLPEDRLWEPGLRQRIQAESRRLCALATGVPLVFGTCTPSPSGRLWNELWWAENANLRQVIRKRLLPLYDVFDEGRYFEASPESQPLVPFLGERIGLCICEDLWSDSDFVAGPITYSVNPVADLAAAGATLLLNASASPTALGSWLPAGVAAPWAVPSKARQRTRLLQGQARKHGVPVVYASRTGADGALLFDGGSGIAHPDGRIQTSAPFHEGIVLVDTKAPGSSPREPEEGPWLRTALGVGLRDAFAKQGLEGAVIGLSGGIDSAVVAAIATETLGTDRVLGVALPTRFSSSESLSLAQDQAARLGIPCLTLDADAPFSGATGALASAFPDRAFSLTDENLQSRSRALLLMALTSEPAIHARLGTPRVAVLNTGNKSEAATGYFTLYGDGIGALGLLGDCLKGRVYSVAQALGEAITPGILHRVPTAELRPGQTDEESLAPYRILDAILSAHLEAQRPEEGLLDDLALLLSSADLDQARAALPRILRLLRQSEFKRRQLPFALKVSPKAFGQGRRIPLTAL